jgi:hypothetical protein
VERGLDGVLLDAPPYYLVNGTGPNDELHDSEVAQAVRDTIVDPLHALGAVAVFGEMYNFQRATVTKMLDAGRNTDMYDGTPGFPGKLHDMVVNGDASGLESLLSLTVDTASGWCGTVRTQPDSRLSGGDDDDDDSGDDDVSVGSLKAAATALLAGYYVVRFGPDCDSPYDFTPPSSGPGDEWPGGCFGAWGAANAVAPTLRALRAAPALHPGTPREALPVTSNATSSSTTLGMSQPLGVDNGEPTGGGGAYAALRLPRVGAGSEEAAAVVILNMAGEAATISVDLSGKGLATPQVPTDLINGGQGPAIPEAGFAWSVELPAYGWAAFGVVFE